MEIASPGSPPGRFHLLGDSALLIQLGEEVHELTNRLVHDLAAALLARRPEGLVEVVPAYCSLTVHFSPLATTPEALAAVATEALRAAPSAQKTQQRLVEVPVVYGGEYGPDLPFVAEHNGLTPEEVVRYHTGTAYRVFMLGFAPGFPYLGPLPAQIAAPRLPKPRTLVPAGSVGIAGLQTGIYPMPLPGGWQLIGRCPLQLFDPLGDPPSLLQPGDSVRFRAISENEYAALLQPKTQR